MALDTTLPLQQQLALAHAGSDARALIAVFFALDARLGQFVSQAKEPILTQMRIAWWRDQLAKPIDDRPTGDPILDALSELWHGEEEALIALVNGWEELLAEAPLPQEAALQFARGRGACFAAMARFLGKPDHADCADYAGQRWALADLASRMSDEAERDFIIEQASAMKRPATSLPYRLRALGILEKLSQNVLENGRGAMISGRRDMLTIMRLGLLGR